MENKKVLIVDDEENVRRLLHGMLVNRCVVLEAKDGEGAVNMARSHKPGLILMDIMMPNMDGYTACHEIKKNHDTRAIPIVMLTALGQELNVKLAKELGADGYVTKPFKLKDVMDIINRFLPTS